MKNRQITNTVLMIEPVAFNFNIETAANNLFQSNNNSAEKSIIQEKALNEFNRMVEKLTEHGINVIVVKDTLQPHTPDSIFPNNWVTFHQDGKVILYPMYAPNRRQERREDILESLEVEGFYISEIIDYTKAECENVFLEGTGSMVLDRVNKVAYATLSERTNEHLFIEFCEDLEYDPILFHAVQEKNGKLFPIYHTNVMMSITENLAIICLDTIKDLQEKKLVYDFLKSSKKEILELSEDQMNNFAGNVLQLAAKEGITYLVMSNTAYQSLNMGQLGIIGKYSRILVIDIPTIEKYGGGSVRCMMAEVFLPKINEI